MKTIKAKSHIELIKELKELQEKLEPMKEREAKLKDLLKTKLGVEDHYCPDAKVVVTITESNKNSFSSAKAKQFIPESKIKLCYTTSTTVSIRLWDALEYENKKAKINS